MPIAEAAVKVLRGPGLSILVHATGLGIGLVSNVLLARWLSPAGYGIYGFAFGLVFVLSVPLHTGLATLVMRDAAQDLAHRDHSRLAGLVIGAPIFALACSLFGALVLLAMTQFGHVGNLQVYSSAILVAALLLPGLALAAIVGSLLRGIGSPLLGQLPDALLRPVFFTALLGLAWGLGLAADSRTALSLHAIAAAFAITAGVALVVKRLPPGVFQASPTFAGKARLSALAPFSLLAGIQAISSFVATASLGFSYSPDVVGTYRLAELGSALAAMPLGAVSAYAAGGFARAHALGDASKLQREVSHAARVAFAAMLAVVLFLFMAGRPAVQVVVGQAYLGAVAPMLILCVGQIASAMAGPVGAVATMCGHHRQAVTAVCIGLSVQLLLNLMLVPRFGLIGAAIAAAAAAIAWSHWLRICILRGAGVHTSPLYAGRIHS